MAYVTFENRWDVWQRGEEEGGWARVEVGYFDY
jgi:hypothetical protein